MLLQLTVDGDGFVRRECPACRREFKTRPSPQDGPAILWVLMGRVGHANAEEIPVAPPVRACPYCEHVAPGEGWLWSAFRKELVRCAEILEEQLRYQQLVRAPQILGHNPHRTFVALTPRPFPRRLRSDPLGHFERLALPCCGEEVKVRAAAVGRLCCPACGTLQGASPPVSGATVPAPSTVQ